MKKQPIKQDGLRFDLPKQKKHRFLKAVVLLSFFAGGKMIGDKLFEVKPLPFNDNQQLPEYPGTTYNELEELEYQIALDAYELLLDRIYLKSSQMGVVLTQDYKLKIVAYDQMTNTIDVIMQNSTSTVQLKFSAQNLSVLEEDVSKMSDQISQLMILLNVPILQVPIISTFDSNLKDTINQNMDTTIEYYASSNTGLSDGDIREEFSDSNLISGRDYYFFSVYGYGQKNGVDYDIVTTISMRVDDYEIAGIDDLIEFFKQNPTDERFVINMSYQESQNTLQKLNDKMQQDSEFTH